MQAAPDIASDSSVRKLLLTASGMVISAVALLVIFGWLADLSVLIRLSDAWPAMRFNTALYFLLFGLAFILLGHQYLRFARALALACALLASATLLQYLLGLDFGIDQLFIHDYLTLDRHGLFPGRMSPATACNFILATTGLLLLMTGGKAAQTRAPVIVLVITLLLAQTLVVLVSFAIGMSAAYQHIFFIGMAVHTASLFLLIGTSLLYLALKSVEVKNYQWLPVILVVVAFSFSSVLWLVVKTQQENHLAHFLRIESLQAQKYIERALKARATALQRQALRWNYGTPYELWRADSESYMEYFDDIKCMAWIDTGGQVRWRLPQAAADAAVSVMSPGLPDEQAPRILPAADGNYYMHVPLLRQGHADGHLYMLFGGKELIQNLLKHYADLGYRVYVRDGQRVLLGTNQMANNHRLAARQIIDAYGLHLQLNVLPSDTLYEETVGTIPKLVLGTSLFMGLLLIGILHLYLRSKQQEIRLTESEQKYFMLLNELHSGVFVAQDYRFVFSNQALQSMLGYSQQELLELTFEEVIAPEYLPVWRERFASRANADTVEPVHAYELQLLKKGKLDRVWIEVYAQRSSYNGMPSVLGVIRDLTQQKALEAQLAFNRERIELVAAGASEGIWDWDVPSGGLFFSARFEELLGFSPGEMPQHYDSWHLALHPDDEPQVMQQLKRHLEQHEPYRVEHRLRQKNGGYGWYLSSGQAKWDENGKPLRMAGSLTDIGLRKQQELALQVSEERFRLIVNGVQEYAIYMLDKQGNILTWNTGAERNKGYKAEEIIGKNFACFFEAEDIASGQPQRELELAASAGTMEAEAWRVRKDGSRFWADIVLTAIRNHTGELIGYAKVVRDLTERRQNEMRMNAALHEKETLLKEVYHRVKNNLQVIRSLLNLQSRSLKDAASRAALADTASRINAMSLVHEKLYRSGNLAAIVLQDYVADLIDQLRQSWATEQGIEIRQQIAALEITLDTAIPLGLLLNELVSNSFKHGFPNHRTGVVEVSLLLDEHGGAVLRVADDGIGFPAGVDLRKTASMGLKLADSLAGQLGGKLEIGHGDNGGAVFSVIIDKFS